MKKSRSKALEELVSELEAFEVDLNEYYDDAEPQGVHDALLTGKLGALAHFCNALGWSNLSQQLNSSLPLRCSAVETMEIVKGFVLPEIRRLIGQTDVDAAPSPSDWYWQLVHPRINALARPRLEAGFFGDAVEASFKEVNDAVNWSSAIVGSGLGGARATSQMQSSGAAARAVRAARSANVGMGFSGRATAVQLTSAFPKLATHLRASAFGRELPDSPPENGR